MKKDKIYNYKITEMKRDEMNNNVYASLVKYDPIPFETYPDEVVQTINKPTIQELIQEIENLGWYNLI